MRTISEIFLVYRTFYNFHRMILKKYIRVPKNKTLYFAEKFRSSIDFFSLKFNFSRKPLVVIKNVGYKLCTFDSDISLLTTFLITPSSSILHKIITKCIFFNLYFVKIVSTELQLSLAIQFSRQYFQKTKERCQGSRNDPGRFFFLRVSDFQNEMKLVNSKLH